MVVVKQVREFRSEVGNRSRAEIKVHKISNSVEVVMGAMETDY